MLSPKINWKEEGADVGISNFRAGFTTHPRICSEGDTNTALLLIYIGKRVGAYLHAWSDRRWYFRIRGSFEQKETVECSSGASQIGVLFESGEGRLIRSGIG